MARQRPGLGGFFTLSVLERVRSVRATVRLLASLTLWQRQQALTRLQVVPLVDLVLQSTVILATGNGSNNTTGYSANSN